MYDNDKELLLPKSHDSDRYQWTRKIL